MKIRSLLIVSLFLFVLYSCKKGDVVADNNPPGGTTIVYNINKTTLLGLVNDIRKSGCTCGTTMMSPVAAISWNDQLAKVAYDHSKDMLQNNYFSHTGLDGSSPGDRITAGGYSWKTYGENLAVGYSSEQSVVNGWLGSEGHCKNIMNGAFKEMGAGREGNYWTQVFGSK